MIFLKTIKPFSYLGAPLLLHQLDQNWCDGWLQVKDGGASRWRGGKVDQDLYCNIRRIFTGEDKRLARTRQASEETGSTGSVRSEAREERISRHDKAEMPSADADKPSTWAYHKTSENLPDIPRSIDL